MTEKPSVYKTKSVEEVAFLRLKQHRLLGKTEEGRYNYAVFLDSKKLQEDVCNFYNGSDEKRLFDELRNAKQYLLDSNG